MALNRRNFLRATLAGAAVAAGSSAFAACGGKAASTEGCPAEKGSCPNSKAELKISFQEGIAPGANLNEKFDLMEKLGVVGFEPGGRGLKDRVKDQGSTKRTQHQSERHLCWFPGVHPLDRSGYPQAVHGHDERDHCSCRRTGFYGCDHRPGFQRSKTGYASYAGNAGFLMRTIQ